MHGIRFESIAAAYETVIKKFPRFVVCLFGKFSAEHPIARPATHYENLHESLLQFFCRFV